MSAPEVVTLDGRTLTPAAVVAIARGRAEARIGTAARERNAAAERLVRGLVERGELVYGVTTGVGVLRSAPAAREAADDHQWRLLRSHAGGGGAPLTVELVRAAMAVRLNQLGAGGAGVGNGLLDALEARCARASRRSRASSARSARATSRCWPRSASRWAARARAGSATRSCPPRTRSPPTTSPRSTSARATGSAS